MFRKLVVASAFVSSLALANPAPAPTQPQEVVQVSKKLYVNPSRLIKVLGAVGPDIVKKANQLLALADSTKEPIYVLINSPGGSVRVGNVFIDAMTMAKSRGVQIKCLTSIYAASMAFSIFANCSEKYVLANTQLLFHPARIGLFGVYTAEEFELMHKELKKIDNRLQDFLLRELEIDKEVMLKAYYDEKWWEAEELQKATRKGWLNIVDDVVGIDSTLFSVSPGKVRSEEEEGDHQQELEEYGYVILRSKGD